jgi:hypothetical protein
MVVKQNPTPSYDQDLASKGLKRSYVEESVTDSFGLCYREVIVPIGKERKPKKRGSAGVKK